jgi:hypothetical protein
MVSNMKAALPGDEFKELIACACGMYKFSLDGQVPRVELRKTTVIGNAAEKQGQQRSNPTLPSGRCLQHYPQYFPPDPPQVPAVPPATTSAQPSKASGAPMSSGLPTPGNGSLMGNKEVFSFIMPFFGCTAEVSGGRNVPPMPPSCSTIAAPPQQAITSQGPAFDILVDTFGQMLNGGLAPPQTVALPPAATTYPVQFVDSGTVTSVPVQTSAKKTTTDTWVRVVGPTVFAIKLAQDHMTITATSSTEVAEDKVVTESAILTVDYQLMRDGTTAVGVITSFDARIGGEIPEEAEFDGIMEELGQLQKALNDKPFAMSLRVYDDALVIGNVRLPELTLGGMWMPMTALGGRYSRAGEKMIPKPKVMKAPAHPPGYALPIPPAYNPAYPTGVIGAPIMQTVPAPACVPQGVVVPSTVSPYPTVGPVSPNCPSGLGAYPYPSSSGTGYGCGTATYGAPQGYSTPPVLMPPPVVRIHAPDCPAPSTVPPALPAARPVMLPPNPPPENH